MSTVAAWNYGAKLHHAIISDDKEEGGVNESSAAKRKADDDYDDISRRSVLIRLFRFITSFFG